MAFPAIQYGIWIFSIIASAPLSYGCTSDYQCPEYWNDSDEEYCCYSSYCCDYSAKYGYDFTDDDNVISNIFKLGVGAIVGIVLGVIALLIFICVGIACCCCSSRSSSGTVVRNQQTVGVVQTGMVSTTYTQQPQPGQQYPAPTAYPVAQPAYPVAQTSYPTAQPGYSGAQPAYANSPPAYPVGQAPYQAPQQPNPMHNQGGYKNAPMPEPFGSPPSYSS